MIDSPLRAQLRTARQRKDLTQAALAERSGASRVTIARFEGGKSAQDLRLGTLTRVCEALGLELALAPRGGLAALEAGLERAREATRRQDLRRRHAVLAARLLAASGPEAAALVKTARANVTRWERERLCSRHLSSRWRRMLRGPAPRIALALLRDDEWTDALLQSSPWTFALEPAAA